MPGSALIADWVDLQPLNTLALPARARYFAKVESVEQLRECLLWAQRQHVPLLVLGGGSNVILAADWPGLVLQIAIAGKKITRIAGGAEINIGAGENWHGLVQWSLAQGLYGLENLTLIPGTAGAAPIQNIGAYGVELGERLLRVRGVDLGINFENDFSVRELSVTECELGYRDSIFKNALRNRFVITEIVLQLSEQFEPVLSYPTLREALATTPQLTALDVEKAVRQIRQSRLPDPIVLPNAGSFFKNPVVTHEHFVRLQNNFPAIPHFFVADSPVADSPVVDSPLADSPVVDSRVKIPAAWLVEHSGWKGKRVGAVGVHEKQALVLIHYPGHRFDTPPARALLDLAATIQRDVLSRFGIALELEPTIYGAH